MSENKRKFNIIDALVVLVVLGVVAGGVWFFSGTRDVQTTYARYIVELRQARPGYANLISIGGEIRDSVRNYLLGTVTAVHYQPAVQVNFNHQTGTFEEIIVPDRYDIHITIEGPASITQSEIRINGQPIRVGMDKFLRMHTFAGIGIVIGIDIEE